MPFTSEEAAALNRSRATPFWERYIPEPNTGCWLWLGATWRKGYGCVGDGEGHTVSAHRRAWVLTNGPIPDGLHVLHRCDQPSCINPEHLFLGTNLDNQIDKLRKGRAKSAPQHGPLNPMSKITEPDVIEIRRMAGKGESTSAIASAYGLAERYTRTIISGRAWRHVPMDKKD